MQEYNLEVSLEQSGLRLDIFISDFFKENDIGISRTLIQRLIADGKVTSNQPFAIKSHYKIKRGDQFRLILEDKKDNAAQAENITLNVVYEDDYLAVIDKPVGLVVHPAPGNYEHTLVNALLYRFKKLSDVNPMRPGIVHRLDKETSGLLVVVKDNSTHLHLARQFSEHSIKRQYIAIVKGRMEFDEQVIELPIGRHPTKRKNMSVGFGKNTRYAKTYYRTLKRERDFSLLELEPFTGRTHQLRVHLSFMGHPILGDTKYGKDNVFSRLALHAKYLGFIHPKTEKFIEFFSNMPKEFADFMKKA